MAIKRFVAETWDEALRQLRAEFGDSAVILHTKTYKDGGVLGLSRRSVVEITASDDEAMARTPGPTAASALAGIEEIPADTRQNYSRLLEKAYQIAASREQSAAGASVPPTNGSAKRNGSNSSPDNGNGTGRSTVRVAPSVPGGKVTTSSGLFRTANGGNGGGNGGGHQDSQRIESLLHDVSELKALVARLASNPTSDLPPGATPAVDELHQRLSVTELSRETIQKVIAGVIRSLSGTQLDDPQVVVEAAVKVVSDMIPVAPAPPIGGGGTRVIAMIGPTGVGKTTTLSKLAANLMIRDRVRVGFITIDTYRLGATEQLRTLANVLDVPMRVVMSPGEMRTAVREMSGLEVVFIDTAGRSHRDRLRMNELKTFLDAGAPDEVHLCMSATTHPGHMLSVLDHFGSLTFDRMILTKLDEAVAYGPAIDIILRANRALSYTTTGQNIPDDIELASGERLARLLLGIDSIEL